MLAELDEIINAEIKDPKLAELVKDILGEPRKGVQRKHCGNQGAPQLQVRIA